MRYLKSTSTVAQSVATNGLITYTTDTTNSKCTIVHTGSNFTIDAAGVYMISANIDLTPTSAGVISMKLLNNNVTVATASVTGVAATTTSMSLTTLVNVLRSCLMVNNTANLQVQLTGAASVSNASIVIVQVA